MTDVVIELAGTIVPHDWIWPEDSGLISAQMLSEALQDAGPSTPVLLRVNSDGGVAEQGEAMRVLLANHAGRVTVHVVGAAHSAASLMVMGADEIIMSTGSLMLIHDPRNSGFGTAADLAQTAQGLEAAAEGYAQVYADRAAITLQAARAIMRAETTYTASAAVAAGFADRVADEPGAAVMQSAQATDHARAAVMSSLSQVRDIQTRFLSAQAAQSDPSPQADPALFQSQPTEDHMDPEVTPNTPPQDPAAGTPTPPAATPVAPVAPAPAPAPLMQADIDAAVAQERQRVSTIRSNARGFMAYLSEADVDLMITEGLSVDQANARIMARAAADQPPVRGGRATITRDEGETRVNGMIGALMNRVNPTAHALEGPSEQFRGMRIRQLAMMLGGSNFGFDEQAQIRSGMRSQTIMSGGGLGISDFSYITSEVLNRTLRAAYSRRAPTYRRISRQRSAPDFRTLHSVNWGADLAFKPVTESGEYLASTIEDQAGKLKLAKFGRQAKITFEAVVNDDMGIFDDLPREFSRAGINLESKIVWSLIRDNAKAPDGKVLFHADHGNLAAAGAIDVTRVAAARKAMWEQRSIGSKDKDDFIEVEPDLLFVPPALESAAMQFVTTTTPAKREDTNPWASSLEPVTEARLGAAAGGADNKWYLFSSELPPCEHALLEGYENPTVSIVNGTNPDDVDMVARHFFAGAVSEHRGAYRVG